MEIMGKWFESGGNSKYNPSGGVTNLTAAQAGGELAGGGFQAYHPLYSSKVATNAQLQALGISSSASSSTVNINNLIAAAKTAIASTASSLITKYGNASQSGTNRTLESALGVNTNQAIAPGGVSGNAAITFNQNTLATVMHGIIENLGPGASISKINKATSGSIAQGMAGSQQDKAYQQDVLNLIATGQTKQAQELVSAHKAAMASLGQEMYAAQTLKDGEELNLQATMLKDQTQMISDAAQSQLTIAKAEEQKINDAASEMVTAMKDAQQTMDDQMAGIAQAIKDNAAIATDSGNSIVDAINDQTQIQVDQIGERGLYGLNLITQQLQVTADITKAYWDQQIDVAQYQLDALQQQADAAESAAQINLDQVQSQQDLLIAQAQQSQDTINIQQEARIAAATAHADSVQLHADTTLIGPAQIAVDMNANAPKAQQDVFAGQLDKANGLASKLTDAADNALTTITKSANGIMNDAQDSYDTVNYNAQTLVTSAGDSLKSITDYFTKAIAQAGSVLTGDQTSAALAEAPQSAAVAVSGANASTEFAGSGLVVNMYGMDFSDASAVTNSLTWAARNTLNV
jgi:hypothetical protein